MNVAFNYVKFATYSAVPFVIVLTLNVAVIWRTVRVSPDLRRNVGGGVEMVPVGRHVSTCGPTQGCSTVLVDSASTGSGSLQLPVTSSASHRNNAWSSITASQVRL